MYVIFLSQKLRSEPPCSCGKTLSLCISKLQNKYYDTLDGDWKLVYSSSSFWQMPISTAGPR